MISTRNGNLIYGRHAVPVREVVDAICDRAHMDWICARYPLKPVEVLECLDAVADIDKLGGSDHLILRNSSDNPSDVTIEITSISDIFFLKVMQYGKVFLENEYDFNLLYDKGFRMCAIESFEDIVNGSVGYESSEIHTIVVSAILDIAGPDFDKELFIKFLKEEDEAQV